MRLVALQKISIFLLIINTRLTFARIIIVRLSNPEGASSDQFVKLHGSWFRFRAQKESKDILHPGTVRRP